MFVKYLVILFCILSLSFSKPVFADGGVVINEALVHPSNGNKEWVEFYTSGTDLTNYWVDDDTDFAVDTGGSSKKQITTPVQGVDTHHVLFELSSSMFNNDADTIVLFSPEGQLIDSYTYTDDPGVDISIGRTPDAIGDFSVLANATRGSANSASKPPDTPTPKPTAKPTKEPKTPTAATTKSDTTVSTTVMDDDLGSSETGNESTYDVADGTTASLGARPTSILGIATKAAEKKKTTPSPGVMVKGAATNIMSLFLTSFGGLFFLSCGILIYLKKKGIWN